MKKYLKIALWLIKLNVEKDLIYSLNTWFLLATTTFYSLAFILSLKFVFLEVDSIMGYSFRELLLLMLGGQLFWYVHQVFIRKSLQNLAALINTGKLDMLLTKPLPVKRLLIFLEFDQRHVIPALVTLLIIIYELSKYDLSLWQIWGLTVFFINGVAISFFFTVIFTAMTFWSGRNDAIFEIVMYFVDTIRLPMSFFSPFLKIVFTFIIPVIPIMNPSFQIIYGKVDTGLIISTVIVTFVLFILAEVLWKKGLENYTSAN